MRDPLHPLPWSWDDDTPQDEQRRTSAARARAMDPRALRTVFFDLVGRPPFAAEYEAWLGRGLSDLLDHLLGGEEFWAEWWEEQLYYFMLIDQFRPTTDSASAVPKKLAEGRLSVRDALHRIALTSSFDLRNPGADTFVTVVMEQMCGITVQEKRRELELGKAAYDGRPARFLERAIDCQADVVKTCVEHKRASQHLVEREFERLIKREPERKLVGSDGRRLHRDPYDYLSLVREWFLSPAYLDRLAEPVAKSNRLFVRGMFVDLCDRLPEEEEMEPMRYALDGLSDARPLRSVLVRLLLDGGEAELPDKGAVADPTAWVAGRFRRLLGREATGDELKTFVTVFHEPMCRPETVVYALTTNAEYHTY